MQTLTSTQLYLRLLRYVKPHRGPFALAIFGMMLVAATEPALPAILKPLLDGTFVEKDERIMRWTPFVIVAIFIVRGIAEYIAQYAINWVGNRVVMDLRNAMFDKLLELPAPFYDNHPAGNLMSKVTFDVTQVTNAATTVLTVIVRDGLAAIGLLSWMLWLNWKLTLLSLAMTPAIIIVVRMISGRLRRSSRDVQSSMGNVTQVLQEAIEGHKVVKLFGGRKYEARRFGDEANRVRRYLMKQTTAAAASVPAARVRAIRPERLCLIILCLPALIGCGGRRSRGMKTGPPPPHHQSYADRAGAARPLLPRGVILLQTGSRSTNRRHASTGVRRGDPRR